MGREIIFLKGKKKKARNDIEIDWIVGDHGQGSMVIGWQLYILLPPNQALLATVIFGRVWFFRCTYLKKRKYVL